MEVRGRDREERRISEEMECQGETHDVAVDWEICHQREQHLDVEAELVPELVLVLGSEVSLHQLLLLHQQGAR